MRIVRLLALFVLAGGVTPLPADPATDTDNPAAHDPDATPRAYTEKPRQETGGNTENANAERTPTQEKNDWLVRAYEEQLQARSLAEGQPQSNNLYTEITSDPELAKAAGLTPAATPAVSDLRAGNGNGVPSLTLRGDSLSPEPAKTNSAKPAGSAFNPILAPLDPSEAEAMHSLFSSLPALSPGNAPAHLDSNAIDPGALDTPGMTAAESDPAKSADLNLTLDRLPGEQDDAEKPHHDLALAMPMRDADQAQKEQPVAPGQQKTAPPVPINPLLLKDTESATEHMVPDPPPIRGQVDDPYDILR